MGSTILEIIVFIIFMMLFFVSSDGFVFIELFPLMFMLLVIGSVLKVKTSSKKDSPRFLSKNGLLKEWADAIVSINSAIEENKAKPKVSKKVYVNEELVRKEVKGKEVSINKEVPRTNYSNKELSRNHYNFYADGFNDDYYSTIKGFSPEELIELYTASHDKFSHDVYHEANKTVHETNGVYFIYNATKREYYYGSSLDTLKYVYTLLKSKKGQLGEAYKRGDALRIKLIPVDGERFMSKDEILTDIKTKYKEAQQI